MLIAQLTLSLVSHSHVTSDEFNRIIRFQKRQEKRLKAKEKESSRTSARMFGAWNQMTKTCKHYVVRCCLSDSVYANIVRHTRHHIIIIHLISASYSKVFTRNDNFIATLVITVNLRSFFIDFWVASMDQSAAVNLQNVQIENCRGKYHSTHHLLHIDFSHFNSEE